jgi:Cys-rich protein (TIGR01571 family)
VGNLGGLGLLTHFGSCYTCKLRVTLRAKYGLPAVYEDCLLHYFCWCCALRQEAQELRLRTRVAPSLISTAAGFRLGVAA